MLLCYFLTFVCILCNVAIGHADTTVYDDCNFPLAPLHVYTCVCGCVACMYYVHM